MFRSAIVSLMIFCSLTNGNFTGSQAFEAGDVTRADRKRVDAVLDRLVAGTADIDPVAGAALVVSVDGKVVYQGAAGCAMFRKDAVGECARKLRPDTKVRVASISKMALALGLLSMVEEGIIDLDTDASTYLGWSLRNPDFPDRPITVRHLATHLSTIRDPAEYWVIAPAPFTSIFAEPDQLFADKRNDIDTGPGTYFTYANLNSGILASVMERASGQRFDDLMEDRVFGPLDLDVGYNWFGVSQKARRKGATLYRLIDGQWTVQKDGKATLIARTPDYLATENLDLYAYLDRYEPGENASIFSPQGGLRASALDLASLAHKVAAQPAMLTMVWTANGEETNGNTEAGYFEAYGLGTQKVTGAPEFHPGLTFTGHAGEAYGLYSGAWVVGDSKSAADEPAETVISFVTTGTVPTPAKGRHPGFNAIEQALLDAGLSVVKTTQKTAQKTSAHGHDEPRPYDPDRDAMSDVDLILERAQASGRKPLLVLGANWCHDSRGLAAKFEKPRFQSLIAENFELLYVDVGERDRNLDVAVRFGVNALMGTPNVLVLDTDGTLLNRATVSKWRRAASISDDETYTYFEGFTIDGDAKATKP